jgi:hypothetical protein
MKRENKIEHLLDMHKPGRRNSGGKYGGAMRTLSGIKPNKERPLADRMLKAYQDCRDHMHFLSGIMYVMPKGIPMEHEAEALLLQGLQLLRSPESTAVIRQISKHGDKIVKLMKKVRVHTRQLDEDLTSAMAKI